jgi:hypothetical protein
MPLRKLQFFFFFFFYREGSRLQKDLAATFIKLVGYKYKEGPKVKGDYNIVLTFYKKDSRNGHPAHPPRSTIWGGVGV